MRATLATRLSLAFSALLLACCGVSAWLQLRAGEQTEQVTIQRLSGELAAHIAGNRTLVGQGGLDMDAVRELFNQLMAVNPSVEVYLLDLDGRILAASAPPGHLKRDAVGLRPIRQLLSGMDLPLLGDDPRTAAARKVFSAAPLQVDGRTAGYIYVVLMGEAYGELMADIAASSALRTTLWALLLVALLGLAAGWIGLHWITRPLRRLTSAVEGFEKQPLSSADEALPAIVQASRRGGEEIATLGETFARMARRTATQWRELSTQDQQRRELYAHLSHDLRTPLTTMHGCLETLLVKSDALDEPQRRHYLELALGESRRVGRLSQELFELARLESGLVKPEKERFALAELVQDLFQKLELAADARQQRLRAEIAPALPAVDADLGMIERVLTNLLDNAIRHTPAGGRIVVKLLTGTRGGVRVEVSDTGPGIPSEMREGLFKRPMFSTTGTRGGGLGLMIVQRMLQLHSSEIRLLQQADQGAVFSFELEGCPPGGTDVSSAQPKRSLVAPD